MKDYTKVILSHIEKESSYAHEMASLKRNWDFEEKNIQSPIERVLYSALLCVMNINEIRNDEPIEILYDTIIKGVRITPQYKIGKYRVDFLIEYEHCYMNNPKGRILNRIIVECDSQEFHDTTEKQRRYEKERERELKKQGYTVFRYTGKEILENSIKTACEILNYVHPKLTVDLAATMENY